MSKNKISKKFIIIPVILVVFIIPIISFIINGLNFVPLRFRNEPVSFLTPDLSWGDRPSDVIMKYGLPNEVGEVSDITGERDFDFSFTYDEKDVTLCVTNRYLLNAVPHRYYYSIEFKTPKEAKAFFDECHTKIMDFHKDDSEFHFNGTTTDTDFDYVHRP